MSRVISAHAAGQGIWTGRGRDRIAFGMSEKGRAFVGSAMLLKQHGGSEFVVLHLLCQGIEILGKGYLLSVDYDTYTLDRLRKKYGHDLLKLLREVEKVSGLSLLKGPVHGQVQELSALYSDNRLRYGSGFDVLTYPGTASSSAVLRRLAAVLRYADRSCVALDAGQ